MKRFEHQPIEPSRWSDHDLSRFEALGFRPVARIDDGVQTVAAFQHPEHRTWAFLYEGTPYVEYHSVLGSGFAVVSTDTPLRVDEFGEHAGRKDRKRQVSNHAFLPAEALLESHLRLVEELASSRGAPQPVGGPREAIQRLKQLEGSRSLADYRGLLLLAAVFLGTIALAVAGLEYFGD